MAVLLTSVTLFAQIKNSKTESVKIYGNCAMCKATIEKAGNLKNVANVDWNKDSKMATITYNPEKTNKDEILKRIALAGYDNEDFTAPDEAYAKLASCCQYDRPQKKSTKPAEMNMNMNMNMNHNSDDHNTMSHKDMGSAQNVTPLTNVFSTYFSIKDALVKSNTSDASTKANEMLKSIKEVDMNKLSTAEHTVWMKLMNGITANAENIAKSKDILKQRQSFASLSQNIYDLLKSSKQGQPFYYMHCPMFNDGKGANWISKENTVKNPFYGSQMLSCGKVQETIGNN